MLSPPQLFASLRSIPPTSEERTSWVVLTGAPMSGKSTIVAELQRRGYPVHQEQARQFFEGELDRGRNLAELTASPNRLVDEIFARNLTIQLATPPEEVVIFDRSLPDVLAVGLVDGVDVSSYVERATKRRFSVALLFERFDPTPDRTIYHSPEELAAIETYCEEVYMALGTPVMRVPRFTSQRARSITLRLARVEEALNELRVDKTASNSDKG